MVKQERKITRNHTNSHRQQCKSLVYIFADCTTKKSRWNYFPSELDPDTRDEKKTSFFTTSFLTNN